MKNFITSFLFPLALVSIVSIATVAEATRISPKPPTLTLIKTVINDNGGIKQVSDFTLQIDGTTVQSGVPKSLIVGAHKASEIASFGYVASAWGGDCAPDGSITLRKGQRAVCTITNNDIQPISLTGLVGYWKFDEDSGTSANDSSPNNNDGTLLNSPAWVAGKFGNALSFDGIDDYVEVGDKATLDGFNDLSVSLWLQANTNQIGVLVNKYENGANNGYYLAIGDRFSPSDRLTFLVDNSSEDRILTDRSVTDGQWHHVVAIYKGGFGPKIYIDSVEQSALRDGSAQSSIGTSPGRSFRIGQYSPGGYNFYFKGLMDDVQIYNRELSASEVSQIYNAN